MYSCKRNKTHKKLRKIAHRTARKTNRKKFKYELHYFRMNGCKWCDEFQLSLLPKLSNKRNLKTKIFNSLENPELIQKYNIKTYPALVRVSGERYKLFLNKRNMKNILKFLR
tara:strand:- start:180 stop:515 length:336 start_codon:yes stop_codon:yes gene_type:complete